MDYAANLAIFLTEKTGSCLKTWKGKLSAAEQRALFGHFLGKGTIIIDGEAETVEHVVSRCFGLDYEITACITWRGMTLPSEAQYLAALGPCGK